MKPPRLIVTKEHGSWAVLLIPMAVAVGVGQHVSWDELMLAAGAVAVFMSYVPLQTIMRHWFVQPQSDENVSQSDFWAGVFTLTAIVAGAFLLLRGFWLLVPVGAVAAGCFLANFILVRRLGKSVWSDLVAVAGLTATGAAMAYVENARLDTTAFSIWILNFLFFGSTVFYVHMKLRASRMKKDGFSFAEKISIGRMNILYHCVVIGIVLFLAFVHLTPRLAVVAFIPIVIHAWVGTIRLTKRAQFRIIGYALLAESVAFSILLLLTARS